MRAYSDALFEAWLNRPANDKFDLVCSEHFALLNLNRRLKCRTQSSTIISIGVGLNSTVPIGLAWEH